MPSDVHPMTLRKRTRCDAIHPTYLPYSQVQLLEHFAAVHGDGDPEARLEHYLQSAERTEAHIPKHEQWLASAHAPMCTALDHQMEKDERFWVVSALLRAFHSQDRLDAFTRVLDDALGSRGVPSAFSSWVHALGPAEELRLFFEANLPAPEKYKQALREEVMSDRPQRLSLPFLLSVARRHQRSLEGATKVDAILVAPSTGFAVVFEAKVLSDVSSHTTYDATRNQIARNLDVLLDVHPRLMPPLDTRRPERTCFVLVTPQVFLDRPHTRLYGSLLPAYRSDTAALHRDLPHRDVDELAGLPTRLGWTSWERINTAVPGACPWLTVGPSHVDARGL